MLVPNKVIDTLKEWNEQESKLTPEYDKRVTVALLLVCVTSDDLVKGNVDEPTKELIQGV